MTTPGRRPEEPLMVVIRHLRLSLHATQYDLLEAEARRLEARVQELESALDRVRTESDAAVRNAEDGYAEEIAKVAKLRLEAELKGQEREAERRVIAAALAWHDADAHGDGSGASHEERGKRTAALIHSIQDLAAVLTQEPPK